MKTILLFCLSGGLLLLGNPACAITIDGLAEAAYGPAPVLQNVQTSFGNSTAGTIDTANGSELDAGYGVIVSNTLYLVLAGNLEANYNKMEIFLDVRDGGQNQLRGDNPNVDGNGLNRMGYASDSEPGLKFETDFAADFWFGVTGGGAPYSFYANYAELLTASGGTNGYFLGGTGAGSDGTLGGGYNPFGIKTTINNSNTNGVKGGTVDPSWGLLFVGDSGAGVASGIELAIPLAAIGNPTGIIKVCALITSPDHGYLSNQMLQGGLLAYCCPHPPPNLPSIGEPRTADLSLISYQQWFGISVTKTAGYYKWATTTADAYEPPDSNTSSMTVFSITRTGSIGGPVSVPYVISNGTAVVGLDFTTNAGLATFAQGSSTAYASIQPIHDDIPEPAKYVTITLVNPPDGGFIQSPSTMTVAIRDNDEDWDGLSDDFENLYFGTNTLTTGTNDWDNDGVNNLEENCAGTNPADSNVYLRASFSVDDATGYAILTWPSATGRLYDLEYAPLADSSYAAIATGLPATPSQNTFTNTAPSGEQGHYRVRVTSGCP